MKFISRKDLEFFTLMEEQAQAAVNAAAEFHKISLDFSYLQVGLSRLEEIEHDADRLCHTLVNKINTQFITPLDKEDMHALTDRLDDVTDTIEKAASRIGIYNLTASRADLPDLLENLVAITKECHDLISMLKNGFKSDALAPLIAAVHATESKMDKVYRKALNALFEDESIDTRMLIKWKEIYEIIEKATNRAEKLASFIESLMVKCG